MISSLKGTILEKKPPQILIEVSGIGYELQMPITCFESLPDLNTEVIVFCHVFIRENEISIFGFQNKNQRFIFRELIKVNGVGPKLALKILSEISIDKFINVIKNQETKELMNLSGIGKKMSERLIVEMKDKFKHMFTDIEKNIISKDNTIEKEAISALIALGYAPKKAHLMIKKIKCVSSDCETLIREALQTIT